VLVDVVHRLVSLKASIDNLVKHTNYPSMSRNGAMWKIIRPWMLRDYEKEELAGNTRVGSIFHAATSGLLKLLSSSFNTYLHWQIGEALKF
jgi:hypothetical protein